MRKASPNDQNRPIFLERFWYRGWSGATRSPPPQLITDFHKQILNFPYFANFAQVRFAQSPFSLVSGLPGAR